MEKPIIFTTELIPKILDGTKTQTRRVIKAPKWMLPMSPLFEKAFCGWDNCPSGEYLKVPCSRHLLRDDIWQDCHTVQRLFCPYGQVGDRLWVRESYCPIFKRTETNNGCIYKADSKEFKSAAYGGHNWSIHDKVWKPSIHMPRWASRITLEITGIRVELTKGKNDENIPEGTWVWVIEFKKVDCSE